MIVQITEKLSNGDKSKRFGGVRCDVCECDAPRDESLHEMGWFIAPGQHRCPKHFHDDVPGRGVHHETVDRTTKRI